MQEKIVLLILKRKTKLPKTSQHIALESVCLCGQTGTLKIDGKTHMAQAERAAGDAAAPLSPGVPGLLQGHAFVPGSHQLVQEELQLPRTGEKQREPRRPAESKGLRSHCLCALPRRVSARLPTASRIRGRTSIWGRKAGR